MSSLSTAWVRYGQLSLGVRILLFMGLGVLSGLVFGERAAVVQPIGDFFIRLLMMVAIPLVFFNLLAGLSSLSDLRALGQLSVRILAYYLLTTTVALALGLAVMHLLKPGVGLTLTSPVDRQLGTVPGVGEVLLGLVPRNIFAAFAEGNVAQIVVFALVLGVSTLLLPIETRKLLDRAFNALALLFRQMIDLVLRLGPIGLGALAAATVGQYGSEIFGPLSLFIAGVWGAQALMVVFYMVLLVVFVGYSPARFLRKTGRLYATTAATTSSLASLAVSMEIAERELKLPKHVYSFTLPLGAQLNKDGTAIMLSGILLLTAQAAGVQFDLASQVTIVLVGLILSEGSGGIPGGGFVIALIFVQAFHLPVEIAAIVGGVYRLIDMGNTTVNCMGDLVGTMIVAGRQEE